MKILFIAFLTFFTVTVSAQKLPDFKLVDMNGDTLTSENLKGKNVYINVWETWCKPCIEEIPVLNYGIDKTENIVLLAITPSKRSKVEKILQKHPFNLRVIPDAEELSKALGSIHYPTHYFIDTEGNAKEFNFGLGITLKGNKKEAEKIRKKMTKDEWNSLFFEQNKDKFYQKLLALKNNQ